MSDMLMCPPIGFDPPGDELFATVGGEQRPKPLRRSHCSLSPSELVSAVGAGVSCKLDTFAKGHTSLALPVVVGVDGVVDPVVPAGVVVSVDEVGFVEPPRNSGSPVLVVALIEVDPEPCSPAMSCAAAMIQSATSFVAGAPVGVAATSL